MNPTTAPAIGQKIRAISTTPNQITVFIEVTAIERETSDGWLVYGYRSLRRSTPRQTSYPRLYFVARSAK